jgi:UDP-N-acetylglucosamine 2-epimerase (non-hydrolysing)
MAEETRMRSVVIAGARPNFVKVAPLLRALRDAQVDTVLVHTGQHYDWAMSESLFVDLAIPPPDVNLEVGSASHAAQTARVMMAFDDYLDANAIDQVVTVGDVNSTLACALVAAKRDVPVAHVEAGLRSFDRTMPEEVNRIVVDSVSSYLFTPSVDADQNLLAEGADPSRIHLVGNIMVDSLLASLPRALESDIRTDLGIADCPYGVITLHRPALVDDVERFRVVLVALDEIASHMPLVFPAHPRTQAKMADLGLAEIAPHLKIVDPVGYLDFLRLEAEASLVLTDSGGVQEETTVLGVPCLTLRENTERPITTTQGTNELVGLDPERIRAGAERAFTQASHPSCPPLWDGHTAVRVAAILAEGTPAIEWIPPEVAPLLASRLGLASTTPT